MNFQNLTVPQKRRKMETMQCFFRASIKATTLSTRSEDYKAELISDFYSSTKADFEANKLRPIVDKTFKFDDIVNAHLYMESNQTIGKVLIVVEHENKDEL